ncbi:MAG: HEAT repeat domain-containing protein, partial [Gemmatimonadota bacterium]
SGGEGGRGAPGESGRAGGPGVAGGPGGPGGEGETGPGGAVGAADRPDDAALAGANRAGGATEASDGEGEEIDRARIADVLGTFAKGLRAHGLYQSHNQAYHRFLDAVRAAFQRLWERMDVLKLAVEDRALRWGSHRFTVGTGHESLAFLFYKDGIRQITFEPGFEDEVDRFFDVLTRARTMNRQEDDLVTLLWEQNFSHFHHLYVDILAEGVEIPLPPDAQQRIDPETIADDAAERRRVSAPHAPAPSATLDPEEFKETLYFLDDAELRTLQDEVEREWRRDVRGAVVDALFDRLEDPMPERRDEIFGILERILTDFLADSDFAHVAQVLDELEVLLERGDLFDDEGRERARSIFGALDDPELLDEVLGSVEEGDVEPDGEALSRVLGSVGTSALSVLLRHLATAERPELRERLESVVGRLARDHEAELVALIEGEDPVIGMAAARAAGRFGLKTAVPRLRRLLRRAAADVRLVAVEALTELRTGEAMDVLCQALDDDDREVRLTAIGGIGTLGYQPARAKVEQIIDSRAFRRTDLTEKVAFFEAYGAFGSAANVELLDRLLNKRGFLRRRQDPDMRACAALALGMLGTPVARTVLERADGDGHPAVRRAVRRALANVAERSGNES